MLQETGSSIAIYYLAGTLFVAFLVTIIVFYIFLHQKKVNAFNAQLHKEEILKQQAVYKALQEGEEREQKRIAEELHDGISTKLSGLNMNLEYLKSGFNDASHTLLFDKTHDGIREIINELRDISHNLHPALQNETDLKTSLLKYIDQLNSKKQCKYDLYYEVNEEECSSTIKLHCYRIIMELLYNTQKHAFATQASIQVNTIDGKLQIIVEDNGRGFDPSIDNFTGIGLTNIGNRVSTCSGKMNIDSSENGTTTIIELPMI